jgi:hypothetical protein
VLEFKATEYGRARRVIATEEVKEKIKGIGIKKCARRSGFTRIFIRKRKTQLVQRIRAMASGFKSNKPQNAPLTRFSLRVGGNSILAEQIVTGLHDPKAVK